MLRPFRAPWHSGGTQLLILACVSCRCKKAAGTALQKMHAMENRSQMCYVHGSILSEFFARLGQHHHAKFLPDLRDPAEAEPPVEQSCTVLNRRIGNMLLNLGCSEVRPRVGFSCRSKGPSPLIKHLLRSDIRSVPSLLPVCRHHLHIVLGLARASVALSILVVPKTSLCSFRSSKAMLNPSRSSTILARSFSMCPSCSRSRQACCCQPSFIFFSSLAFAFTTIRAGCCTQHSCPIGP